MVSREVVEHVAGLAKLEFADEEMDAFVHQFQKIVAYVDRLNEVGVEDDGVRARGAGLGQLREDRVEVWPGREESLQNAPERQESLFKVPRVVDRGNGRGAP